MRVIDPEKTVLVVDIGNTNIVCGIYKQDTLVWFARFQSSRNRTSDEYYSIIKPLLSEAQLGEIQYVALASVVPELARLWMHLLQKYSSAEIIEINGRSPLGLQFHVPDPSFIGADLIANAFAAWKKYHTGVIVIDLGTATKVQVTSPDGMFEGTVIAPGLKAGASSLFKKAALLSEIELSSPSVILGTNTRDALLSGIVHGHALMLEAFVNEIKAQYSYPLLTVITGGICDLVVPLIPSVDTVDKTLTLDGLHLALKTILREA